MTVRLGIVYPLELVETVQPMVAALMRAEYAVVELPEGNGFQKKVPELQFLVILGDGTQFVRSLRRCTRLPETLYIYSLTYPDFFHGRFHTIEAMRIDIVRVVSKIICG